jgi:hypothetical protein
MECQEFIKVMQEVLDSLPEEFRSRMSIVRTLVRFLNRHLASIECFYSCHRSTLSVFL